MRRFIAFLLSALLLVSLCGCHKVSIDATEGTVRFRQGRIQVIADDLTADEVETVRQVLNGKKEYVATGVAGCGFSRDVSITIGKTTYALAMDKCPAVKNMETNRFIDITNEERKLLEEIFIERGGYFPCV